MVNKSLFTLLAFIMFSSCSSFNINIFRIDEKGISVIQDENELKYANNMMEIFLDFDLIPSNVDTLVILVHELGDGVMCSDFSFYFKNKIKYHEICGPKPDIKLYSLDSVDAFKREFIDFIWNKEYKDLSEKIKIRTDLPQYLKCYRIARNKSNFKVDVLYVLDDIYYKLRKFD